nr:NPCBM/NEW2 domain-containing protein [Fimbriiglobus sp.]
SLGRVKKPKGAFARITTSDGSRVTVSAVSSDGQTLEATPLVGGKLTLPVADVVAVDVLGGKAVYLSDLKPKAAKEEAFGAVAWPWASDKSVKGNPLRLKTDRGEEAFGKGLGLHPKTTLTYDLGGKYRRFEATVGLDATTGRRGAVDVTVLVDGKPTKLDGLTFASGVKPLSLDVTKAKELTLIVDYGPGGDVQDDVIFADARLVE